MASSSSPPSQADHSDAFRARLQKLREQFYSTEEFKSRHRVQRSMTDRVGTIRDSGIGECSLDSGLSSPTGSQTSTLEDTCTTVRPVMTRHLSMDNTYPHYMQRLNVHDLETEAKDIYKAVDDLASTSTMRRRRDQSSNLSITDRRRLATQAIGSYAPVAPARSQWGLMFDDMMSKLKGLETPATDSSKSSSSASVKASSSAVRDSSLRDAAAPQECLTRHQSTSSPRLEQETLTKGNNNFPSYHKQSVDTVDKACVDETTTAKRTEAEQQDVMKSKSSSRLMRSVTENYGNRCKPTVNVDMKSLMRSISFQRPDLATYNQPISRLRRTDSNNEVWIEQQNQQNKSQQALMSSNSAAKPASGGGHHKPTNLKRSTTWRRLTKMFNYTSSKSKA